MHVSTNQPICIHSFLSPSLLLSLPRFLPSFSHSLCPFSYAEHLRVAAPGSTAAGSAQCKTNELQAKQTSVRLCSSVGCVPNPSQLTCEHVFFPAEETSGENSCQPCSVHFNTDNSKQILPACSSEHQSSTEGLVLEFLTCHCNHSGILIVSGICLRDWML